MPELRGIDQAAQDYTGLSRRVLDYSIEMKRIVDAAKEPGFSESRWAGLATYINTEKFIRVGNFKEVMTWPEYIAFLTPWAIHSEWEGSFKRVTESGNLVILELEERSGVGGHTSVVNSVSVYAFGADGRIEHLDIYLQMPLPDPEMLASYAGVKISK